MRSTPQKILAYLARETLRRHKPTIIGITGSVGKTSTREAIFAVLKKKYRVRRAEKNYNNEIGLPLTILGIQHYGKNVSGWLSALFRVAVGVILRRHQYPEILVLEYGVDRPGDMDYLLSIARPDIAVVTAIGDIPVHVEFFKDPEELIKEKTKIVVSLPDDGYAILNHDDYAVLDMKKSARSKAVTYGFEKHADFRIADFSIRTSKDADLGDIPEGIGFRVEHKGSAVPVLLAKAFGKPGAYSASAASAVAFFMGMNLVEISSALRDFVPPPGRLRLLLGIKDSWILDDTYNAAPESMRAALDTLEALPGRRKIAVLGDMLEIGKYSEAAHRAIGDQVAGFMDLLFTVGPRAKFIAEEAVTRGIETDARKLNPSQVFKFADSVSAGKALDPLIRAGDLVLVKGSQSMRMEKAVFEVMAEPQKAAELLVRQEEHWR